MYKEFDIEAFKAGDVAISSGGKEFRYIGDMPDKACGIVVLSEKDELIRLSGDGKSREHSIYNLTIMKPKTKVVWINLYPHDGNISRAISHRSEEAALNNRANDALNEKPIRVEISI